MANCTHDEVKLIISTGMADADIDQLIILADQEIVDLGFDSLDADTQKRISMVFTACMVAMHDPASQSIGEYSEQHLNATGWQAIKASIIAQYTPGGSSGAATGGTFKVHSQMRAYE